MSRSLPEKYRLASNIFPGYEIRVACPEHDEMHWVRVVEELYVYASSGLVMLTVDTDDFGCLGGNRLTFRAGVEVYSRRPAAEVES